MMALSGQVALSYRDTSAFPTYKSGAWWVCLLTAVLLVLLLMGGVVLAAELLGFTSSQLVNRSGVANSSLLIQRSGALGSEVFVARLIMPTIATLAATDVGMVGYPHATLNGQVTDMGNLQGASVFWQWGYDTSYGNVVGLQTAWGAGNYATELSGFNPDSSVYYRFVVEAYGQYSYGNGQSYRITETPGFWKITTLVPLAFIVGIVIVLMKALSSGSGINIVLAVLMALIFFLVAVNFMPVMFDSLRAMWGG